MCWCGEPHPRDTDEAQRWVLTKNARKAAGLSTGHVIARRDDVITKGACWCGSYHHEPGPPGDASRPNRIPAGTAKAPDPVITKQAEPAPPPPAATAGADPIAEALADLSSRRPLVREAARRAIRDA